METTLENWKLSMNESDINIFSYAEGLSLLKRHDEAIDILNKL